MADKFIEGAREAGNEVLRFDAAFENVKPCLACEYCSSHEGVCVHKDSMNVLSNNLLDTDLIVFATPLYYFGMSAPIWIAGACVAGDFRILLWLIAGGIDLIGTWIAHPIPSRRLLSEEVKFDAPHLLERCRLFRWQINK